MKNKHASGHHCGRMPIMNRRRKIINSPCPAHSDNRNSDRLGDRADEIEIVSGKRALPVNVVQKQLAGARLLHAPSRSHRIQTRAPSARTDICPWTA